jgi:quercetin dioxygenase-like cupin family protein
LVSIVAERGQATPLRPGGLIMAIRHSRSGEPVRLGSIGDAATRTVALARTPAFEAVHLVVRAGDSIASHRVAGAMTLYCIAGHVRFEGGSPPELGTGDWLYLDPGTPHALEAVTDTSLLLTILFDQSG